MKPDQGEKEAGRFDEAGGEGAIPHVGQQNCGVGLPGWPRLWVQIWPPETPASLGTPL